MLQTKVMVISEIFLILNNSFGFYLSGCSSSFRWYLDRNSMIKFDLLFGDLPILTLIVLPSKLRGKTPLK